MFTVGHLQVPYQWITLTPINYSETCHNPGLYQIFLLYFQLVMSFTSFSLNSLHAGSILCVSVQVSDGGDGRHIFQRDSLPKKRGVPFRVPQHGAVAGYVTKGRYRSYFVVQSWNGMCENVCGVYAEPIWTRAVKCEKRNNQDTAFKCEFLLNLQEL